MKKVTPIFGQQETRQAPMPSRAVTISSENFGIRISKNKMDLSIAPTMMQSIAQGVIPSPGTEEQKLFLIQYLGLSDDVCEMLEITVANEQISFAEALNFHLSMAAGS